MTLPRRNSLSHKVSYYVAIALLISIIILVAIFTTNNVLSTTTSQSFIGTSAQVWVDKQCAIGYRYTGSPGNAETAQLIKDELKTLGWHVISQEFPYMGTTVENILAYKGDGKAVLLGAHYDTRRQADADSTTTPVMGANDGASGVAILLELARVLEISKTEHRIYLAFFDAEDNGRLDGWDWIVGSTYMATHWVESGEPQLQAAIIVDMVGDKDLTIYQERNSDEVLTTEIWGIAAQLGYANIFIPQYKYAIIDDHIPFIQNGVPSIDIIDFDYPYWHTTQDTPDKVSPQSLEVVGKTLETWLENPELDKKPR